MCSKCEPTTIEKIGDMITFAGIGSLWYSICWFWWINNEHLDLREFLIVMWPLLLLGLTAIAVGTAMAPHKQEER